jgi:hypothetical protein
MEEQPYHGIRVEGDAREVDLPHQIAAMDAVELMLRTIFYTLNGVHCHVRKSANKGL